MSTFKSNAELRQVESTCVDCNRKIDLEDSEDSLCFEEDGLCSRCTQALIEEEKDNNEFLNFNYALQNTPRCYMRYAINKYFNYFRELLTCVNTNKTRFVNRTATCSLISDKYNYRYYSQVFSMGYLMRRIILTIGKNTRFLSLFFNQISEKLRFINHFSSREIAQVIF